MEFLRRRLFDKKANLPASVRRYSSFACVLVFFCGIVYSFGLLLPGFTHHTYISENALSPGVVDERFDLGHFMDEKLSELKNYLKSRGGKRDAIPHEWLYDEFQKARLEPYVQNFTFRSPVDGSQSFSGRNVYGVVRAPRGASTEAVVVAIPYDPRQTPAVAVLLGLAKFCRKQIYWSKDVFFVVADHGTIGMQAWLNSYHGMKNSQFLVADQMSSHSGPIQAGVCLEVDPRKGSTEENEIVYNMMNGQLPNLDLLNVAVRLSEKHHHWPTIFGHREPMGESWERYQDVLSIAAQGILRQGIGPTPGLHAVFGAFNIEAVTLRPKGSASGYAAGMTTVAKMLEGILRSVNNLLERFHQSFFFYLLLSPHRYVSIGVYMPAIGLMLLAPLLKACAIWISINAKSDGTKSDSEKSRNGDKTDREKSQDGDEAKSGKSQNGDDDKNQIEGPQITMASLAPVAACFLSSHCIGLLLRFLPDYVPIFASWIGVGTVSEDLLLVLLMIIAISAVVPITTIRFDNSDVNPVYSYDLFRCVYLLELGLALGIISVLNFGLGFMLCLTWAPVFTFMTPAKRWFTYIPKLLIVLLANPFILLFLAHSTLIEGGSGISAAYLSEVALATKNHILGMITNTYVHGDWLFTIITVVLYPLWIQLLILLRLRF